MLPAVRSNRALARSLLVDARSPVRDRVGALTGELHQYLGWLLAETGHTEQARVELAGERAEVDRTLGRAAELAIAHAYQALSVCRATKSTRLTRKLQRVYTQMRNTWPTHAAVRELGDEVACPPPNSK